MKEVDKKLSENIIIFSSHYVLLKGALQKWYPSAKNFVDHRHVSENPTFTPNSTHTARIKYGIQPFTGKLRVKY